MKERDIKNYFGYIAKEAEDGFTGVRKDWNETCYSIWTSMNLTISYLGKLKLRTL